MSGAHSAGLVFWQASILEEPFHHTNDVDRMSVDRIRLLVIDDANDTAALLATHELDGSNALY
jgi:hypothetical protein